MKWSAALLLAAACTPETSPAPAAAVREAWVSVADTLWNLDSPSVWHGADGSAWAITTGKTADALFVFDAATGRLVRTVGREGAGPGEFRRPNGIAVHGGMAWVVERDGQRVQLLRLPDFAPVGSIGMGTLRKPYGLALYDSRPGVTELYVTDDYRPEETDETPPPAELGERVKHFRVRVSGDSVRWELVRAFGATSGEGVLRTVESIQADPAYGRLLIADEEDNDVKVYTLDGTYSGRRVGRGTFHAQAEGIALYPCGERGGWWVMTDQDTARTEFHVFDRASLRHLGQLSGNVVANTDGIWVDPRPVGPFTAGALYAVHNDQALAAFAWTDVARAAGIPSGC